MTDRTDPSTEPTTLEQALLERYLAETDAIRAQTEAVRADTELRRVERYVEAASLLLSQLLVAAALLLR